MSKLTYTQVRDLMREAIAEKGADFKYSPVTTVDRKQVCVYFDPADNTPSCAVGHVLDKMGYTRDSLLGDWLNYEINPESDDYRDLDSPTDLNVMTPAADLIWAMGLDVTEAAAEYLVRFQTYQDGCDLDWGYCDSTAVQDVFNKYGDNPE